MELVEVVCDKFLLIWLFSKDVSDHEREIAERVYYKLKVGDFRLVYTKRLIEIIRKELKTFENKLKRDTYSQRWIKRLMSLLVDSRKTRITEANLRNLKIQDENDEEMVKSTILSENKIFITTDLVRLKQKLIEANLIEKFKIKLLPPEEFVNIT